MTQLRTQLALLFAALIFVGGAEVHASVASTVDGPQSVQRALESGGMGCYDPQSWVWRAPRAERVAVEIQWERPCEIGQLGCDRRPESLADEVEGDQASQFCALKLAHHEKSDWDEPFDNESCLESARELLSIDPDPIQPFDIGWELVCRESDPECRSMPPVPETDREAPNAPVATVAVVAPGAPAFGVGSWATRDQLKRRGIRRRVDRPPAVHHL